MRNLINFFVQFALANRIWRVFKKSWTNFGENFFSALRYTYIVFIQKKLTMALKEQYSLLPSRAAPPKPCIFNKLHEAKIRVDGQWSTPEGKLLYSFVSPLPLDCPSAERFFSVNAENFYSSTNRSPPAPVYKARRHQRRSC